MSATRIGGLARVRTPSTEHQRRDRGRSPGRVSLTPESAEPPR